MARKILIATALIIAVFPYLGFSQSVDVSVTTVLSLLMAAVLLLSRKPKTKELEEVEGDPTDTPSPFLKEMHAIPVDHQKDGHIPSHIAIEHKEHTKTTAVSHETAPSGLQKFPHHPLVRQEKKFIPEVAPGVALPTRRTRKPTPSVVLAHEDQVQPADVPVPAHVQAEVHRTDTSGPF